MLQFDITLEQAGKALDGHMELLVEEGQVQGYLTVVRHQEAFRGRVLRKNHFITNLIFQADGGTEDCDALLRLREDGTLTGVALSAAHVWTLQGTLLRPR